MNIDFVKMTAKSLINEPLIHPAAHIGNNVVIGAQAIINQDVIIGDDCIVEPNVIIDGNTMIGKGNVIKCGSVIGGNPEIGDGDDSDSRLVIGDSNTFMQHAMILGGINGRVTKIGNNNLVMAYAYIGHNCTLENGVIITNCAYLSENVLVEEKARVGGLTFVAKNCSIGKLAMVGGNSKIKGDVPPFVLMDGNPAKAYGLNTVGLERSGFANDVIASLKKAYRMLYRSNQSISEAIQQMEQERPLSEEVNYFINFLRPHPN